MFLIYFVNWTQVRLTRESWHSGLESGIGTIPYLSEGIFSHNFAVFKDRLQEINLEDDTE